MPKRWHAPAGWAEPTYLAQREGLRVRTGPEAGGPAPYRSEAFRLAGLRSEIPTAGARLSGCVTRVAVLMRWSVSG